MPGSSIVQESSTHTVLIAVAAPESSPSSFVVDEGEVPSGAAVPGSEADEDPDGAADVAVELSEGEALSAEDSLSEGDPDVSDSCSEALLVGVTVVVTVVGSSGSPAPQAETPTATSAAAATVDMMRFKALLPLRHDPLPWRAVPSDALGAVNARTTPGRRCTTAPLHGRRRPGDRGAGDTLPTP